MGVRDYVKKQWLGLQYWPIERSSFNRHMKMCNDGGMAINWAKNASRNKGSQVTCEEFTTKVKSDPVHQSTLIGLVSKPHWIRIHLYHRLKWIFPQIQVRAPLILSKENLCITQIYNEDEFQRAYEYEYNESEERSASHEWVRHTPSRPWYSTRWNQGLDLTVKYWSQ